MKFTAILVFSALAVFAVWLMVWFWFFKMSNTLKPTVEERTTLIQPISEPLPTYPVEKGKDKG